MVACSPLPVYLGQLMVGAQKSKMESVRLHFYSMDFGLLIIQKTDKRVQNVTEGLPKRLDFE